MNSISSTLAFENEIPGADVLLFVFAPNPSHFEPNLQHHMGLGMIVDPIDTRKAMMGPRC